MRKLEWVTLIVAGGLLCAIGLSAPRAGDVPADHSTAAQSAQLADIHQVTEEPESQPQTVHAAESNQRESDQKGIEQRLQKSAGDAYEKGIQRGYEDGFQAGRTQGAIEGYQQGAIEGYATGHQAGYDEGRATGFAEGYEQGKR